MPPGTNSPDRFVQARVVSPRLPKIIGYQEHQVFLVRLRNHLLEINVRGRDAAQYRVTRRVHGGSDTDPCRGHIWNS